MSAAANLNPLALTPIHSIDYYESCQRWITVAQIIVPIAMMILGTTLAVAAHLFDYTLLGGGLTILTALTGLHLYEGFKNWKNSYEDSKEISQIFYTNAEVSQIANPEDRTLTTLYTWATAKYEKEGISNSDTLKSRRANISLSEKPAYEKIQEIQNLFEKAAYTAAWKIQAAYYNFILKNKSDLRSREDLCVMRPWSFQTEILYEIIGEPCPFVTSKHKVDSLSVAGVLELDMEGIQKFMNPPTEA